jgi:hypothetical protein
MTWPLLSNRPSEALITVDCECERTHTVVAPL